MLAYAFDSFAVGGTLTFRQPARRRRRSNRRGRLRRAGQRTGGVADPRPGGRDGGSRHLRLCPGRARLSAGRGGSPGAGCGGAAGRSRPRCRSCSRKGEARAIAARSLSEGRIARDSLELRLPPSSLRFTAGDLIAIGAGEDVGLFRIDRVEEAGPSGDHRGSGGAGRLRGAGSGASGGPGGRAGGALAGRCGVSGPAAPARRRGPARAPCRGDAAALDRTGRDLFGERRLRLCASIAEVKRPAVVGALLDPLPRGNAGTWMRSGVRIRLGFGQPAEPQRGGCAERRQRRGAPVGVGGRLGGCPVPRRPSWSRRRSICWAGCCGGRREPTG